MKPPTRIFLRLALAGWTSESTFKKYYLKPVRRPVQPMSSALFTIGGFLLISGVSIIKFGSR